MRRKESSKAKGKEIGAFAIKKVEICKSQEGSLK
jgi:hypothetical protein